MRILVALAVMGAVAARGQQPFTVQQALSAPYSTNLTASPVGATFAWVEHVEGRNNLWVGGSGQTARQLTHNTEDDAQDITSLAFSPDGSLIAYVFGAQTGASGRPANPAHLQRPAPVEILLQPVAGGEPTDVGEGRAPLFAPDGKSLFFLRGGQIMQVSVSVGRVPPPHAVVFDRGTASSLALSPDGKLLAYVSHRRTHNFLAVFDLQAKTLSFPAPSTGNDSAPIFSRDGKYLAWLRWPYTDVSEFATNRVSANPWSVQVMEVATGKTRMVYQPEANKPGSAEPRMSTGEPRLMWTGDGRVLFFAEMDGWVHLYAVGLDGGKATLLTPGEGEVEDATLSSDGRSLWWASNIADRMVSYSGLKDCMGPTIGRQMADTERRHLSNLNLLKPAPKPPTIFNMQRRTFGEGIETHPTVLSDGSVVALASDAFVPMHPVYIGDEGNIKDASGGAISKSYPLHEFVFPDDVSFPAVSTFPSKTRGVEIARQTTRVELKVHGQLFLPGNTEVGKNEWAPSCNRHRNSPAPRDPVKRPAILFFHGGPRRQMLLGYPSMDYYSNAYAMNQYLASRGYIVLSVNYRGGIGYGLNFRQCEHCGGDGAAEYADALGAVAYLRSRPDVDAAHIGIWGGSYGGYFTALGLARNSDLFAAGVDFHGVHEWAREDNAPGDWLRSATNDPDEVARIAKVAHQSSPMADVDKWKSPVLFIHGDDDPDVAYVQTPMLADALRARKVHVEELIFPDELHGFVLHKDWVTAYEAAADFFDRMLKPSAAPVK